MRKFVAEQNVHRLRELLAQEPDGRRRALLQQFVHEEEQKLAQLEDPPGFPRGHPGGGAPV